MLGCDVVDEFQHVDGLADTGAAKQADFSALGKRRYQVDNLDTRFEQFHGRRQLVELGRRLVYLAAFIGGNRARIVYGTAEHIHDAAQCGLTYRHADAFAGALDRHAAAQSIRGSHGDRAHDAVTELLLDLERQALLGKLGRIISQRQCVIHSRHCFARELNIDHSAYALDDLSLTQHSTHGVSFLLNSLNSFHMAGRTSH